MAGNLGAPVVISGAVDKLVSGGGMDSPNPRLRVDVGEPSFFDGRQFRTFKELNIALGATYVVKVVVPVNVILYGLELDLLSGEVKLASVVGGTEGGSFAETLPIFPRNTMTERPTPIYTPQVVITAGGTHTGGTVLDLVWMKVADNSNFSSTVGNVPGDERGVGPNTYYFRLNAIAAATGVLRVRWEERLP